MIIGIKGEQPRSYLSTEPAVLRANRNHFDPVLQIYDRADALESCGHEVDKIEILQAKNEKVIAQNQELLARLENLENIAFKFQKDEKYKLSKSISE